MSQLLSSLIKWAIVLGSIGLLPQATKYFMKEAVKAHQRGPISLVKLNESLWGSGKPYKHKKLDKVSPISDNRK